MAAPIAATAAPVFLGLKLYELLTLIGIVLGPIFAVAITLLVEYRRSKHERRINLFRTLLATFRTAGDANWSVAMNMLLIEFNSHKSVMDARREYMNTVRVKATPENEVAHNEQIAAKQIALVYQVAIALGFKITEGELRTESYVAEGMLLRDNIMLDSQRATRELANAHKRILEIVEANQKPPQQPPSK